MANPVYSTQFFATTLAFSDSEFYVVPDGFVAVVHDISGVIFSDITGVATISVDWDDSIFYSAQIPTLWQAPLQWAGRATAGPGATLTARAGGTAGGSELVVSGYLLTLP